MNHFVPIPFFIIAIIVYIVSKEKDLKIFKLISKIVIILSVIVFAYEYAEYLGYDVIEIVRTKFLSM